MIKKIIATLLSSSITLGMPINALGSTKYKTLRTNAVAAAENEEKTKKNAKLGDLNADNKVDAVDASMILSNYSRYSTTDDTPTEADLAISDINRDNRIDAVDASTVLTYYAYASVDGKLSFEDYLKEKNIGTSDTTTTLTVTSLTTTTIRKSSTALTTTKETTTSQPDTSSTTTKAATTTTTIKTTTMTSKPTTTLTITSTTEPIKTSITTIPADLDTDNDGLTDVYEKNIGTNVNKADTDGDGLKDGEEVKTYKTDPLKYDTDGDTISDGDEVKLKTDPTKASSDGTTSDKDRKFVQKLDKDSDVFSSINTEDNPFKVSMKIKSSGYAESAMEADESGYSGVISGDMVLGLIPEFKYEEGLEVDDVVLDFDIDSKYTENTNGKYAAVSQDLKGIKRFNVFKYFEDSNMLLPIATTYDEENNRISTHVDELGTYCLIDMEKWYENLGITPDEYKSAIVQPVVNNLPHILRMFAPDTTPIEEEDPIDVVYVTFADSTEARENDRKNILESAAKLFSKYEKKQIHIYVTVYTGTSILEANEKKQYATDIDELKDMLANRFPIRNIELGKNEDNGLEYTIVNFFKKNNIRENSDKYMFLIEPVDSKYFDSIITRMKTSGFTTSVISSSQNANLLDFSKTLTEETKGMFSTDIKSYGSPTAEYVLNNHGYKAVQMITPIGWKKVNLAADIIPDYKTEYENIMWNELDGNFDYVDSIRDKYADTDKDGLLDLQEISYYIETNAEGVDEIELKWDDFGNLILPTFGECMKTKSDLFYVHDYIQNMEQWKINLYSKYRILPILSDPMSKDGDFDGIEDSKDTNRLSCVIETSLTTQYGKSKNHGDINYSLDTRDFFKPAKEYNKKLSTWGSVLSTVVYTSNDKRYITYDNEKMHADKMLELHGFNGVEVYDMRQNKDAKAQEELNRTPSADISRTHYSDPHVLRMFIGYKNLEYDGQKKTIIAVVLEGTETSIEEWTSNFDLGSTEERNLVRNWLSSGKSNYVSDKFDEPLKYWLVNNPNELNAFEDWVTAEHHKGFDIAATRCKKFIDSYISAYKSNFNSGKVSFYVTGHSRAAAVANLLSYYLINDKNETFAYTFASPGTTTSTNSNDDVYDSIFNIVNEDDFVPMVPMESWHFSRYGVTATKSIADNYEKDWEEVSGILDYNPDAPDDLQYTVAMLSTVALNKNDREKVNQIANAYSKEDAAEEIQKYLLSRDENYRNNCYKFTYDPDFEFKYDPKATNENDRYAFEDITTEIYSNLVSDSIPENVLPFCLIVPYDEYNKIICQCPAFLMQILASQSCGDMWIMDFLRNYNIAPRFEAAKKEMLFSGNNVTGGIAHPHYLQSYYVLSQNIKASDFKY